MKNLIYIACPYTGTPLEQEDRFDQACLYAAELMLDHKLVYSPISHGHPINQATNMPSTPAFWEMQWRPFLAEADELHVIMLKGWRTSVGVQKEIKLFTQWNPNKQPLLVNRR